MKKAIIAFVLILIIVCGFAQTAPDTLWTKTFCGSGNEIAYSVQQTSDGGFIIVGYTTSFGAGDNDVWLIKTDINGNEIWSETYEGHYQYGLKMEAGYSVQQTNDNGFILLGYASTNSTSTLIFMIKTDENGTEMWERTFPSFGNGEGHSVQQTSDGGYIIVGKYNVSSTNYDVFLIKTYSNGNEEWSQTFGGTSYDVGYSVQQTTDEGYIIVGKTMTNFGDNDVYLIKTDASGNLVWQKTFDNSSSDDYGKSVCQTTDGGYIIVGSTIDVLGYQSVYLIKTNENGNEVWTNSFSSSYSASGYSVKQTIDGGFIITGFSSIPSDQNVFLVKTDENGNHVWSNTFGGDENDVGYSVQQTTDGGFIITGATRSYGAGYWDVWLLKIAPDFIPNFSCDSRFGYSSLEVNFTDDTQIAPNGWNWDFDNDSIIDSYDQNPAFIYNQSGVYDVKLIVERGIRSDTIIKENFIVVQESQLLPPQNPLITISGIDAILNWNIVDNANYYLIYSSDNPFGVFEFLDYTTNDTIYIDSEIISEKDKYFYFIIGFDGTIEDLTRFINNNQRKNFDVEIK